MPDQGYRVVFLEHCQGHQNPGPQVNRQHQVGPLAGHALPRAIDAEDGHDSSF
jgi:hypothetical protein